MSSISPVSSFASTPASSPRPGTSLPIIESAGDHDVADTLDDDYYNYNDNYNNDENYNNENDDEYNNDDASNEESNEDNNTPELVVPAEPSKTPEQSSSLTPIAAAADLLHPTPQPTMIPVYSQTTVEIQHIPDKGVGAWLNYLNTQQRRRSVLETLRSLF